MAFEEKRAWVMLVVSTAAWLVYAAVVVSRSSGSLTDVAYAAPLLWSIAGSIAASVVASTVLATVRPQGANERDQRDREIHRAGEYIGRSFVVVGGVAALAMALARWDPFWIANAVYLSFVLAAVLASVAKIVAYRRGFWSW
jgi:hypothetical protein